MRPKLKAVGSQGSWFVDVASEKLPVAIDHWLKMPNYSDPGAVVNEKRWQELAEAIKAATRVVLTKGRPENDFRREGYIAIFGVTDVSLDEAGLSFKVVDRQADLQ